ncbi:MAG: hypothetical protein NT031_14250, partial [Planctomycetota bacterium]|nr:hypothetical protein [Planctomycetota bacterium]
MTAEAGRGQLAAAIKRAEDAQTALEDLRHKDEAALSHLGVVEAEKTKLDEQIKALQAGGDAAAAKVKRLQQALTE